MLRSGKKKKKKTRVKANSHRQSVYGPTCADALAAALLPILRGLREWRLPKHLLGTGSARAWMFQSWRTAQAGRPCTGGHQE